MENRSASSVFSRDYSSLTKQPSQRFSPGMKSTGKIIYHENLDLICIVDPVEHCIVVLDGQNFTLKRKIASKGIRKGCLYNPIGIGFWYDMVIVADSTNHRICYFDVQTGKVDKVLGQEGKLKGEYQYPTDLVVSNGGLVIVIDSGNARIQAFSAKTGRTQWVLLTASKVHRALPKGSIYNPKILMLHKHILHVCGEKPLMHALDVETGMERYKIYLTHCKQPLSIAALSHDDFAVMDGQTDRICIFNQYGILALKLRYRTFSDLRGSLCFHGTQHRIMVANGMHPSLALYPTFKPISFGTVFESVSTRAVYNVYSFLNYKEADTIRTVCKTCEQLFQQLRLSWDLYPLSANDLVLVHQLYNKWATSKMPNNELVRNTIFHIHFNKLGHGFFEWVSIRPTSLFWTKILVPEREPSRNALPTLRR